MSAINFHASEPENLLIKKICERYLNAVRNHEGATLDITDLRMDITATHLNGCPLNLQKLLDAPLFDFSHDVGGIRRHLNRKTGQLENCFLPRCAR